MKVSPLVWVGAGIFALVYFTGLGVAGTNMQYIIQSVDFTGISSGQIMLLVQNVSSTSIKLNSMSGTVTANGTLIGNISNFQGGILIPGNGQVVIPITVSLSLLGIANQLYSILSSPTGQNNVAFVITGAVNINAGLVIPFTITQAIAV